MARTRWPWLRPKPKWRRVEATDLCPHGDLWGQCPIHKWDLIPIKGKASNEQSPEATTPRSHRGTR